MKKTIRIGIGPKVTLFTNDDNLNHSISKWYDVELTDEYMDDEDGDGVDELHYQKGLTVTCPSVPGAISEGDTEDEAITNISEAIQLVEESRANK